MTTMRPPEPAPGLAGSVSATAITAPRGQAAPLRRASWALRIGAGACFIGHGAFGVLTKAAWVPYFAVVGVPNVWAYRLMPVVGSVDIAAGIAVLVSPRPLVLLYMAVWATWTALLRPLAGESVFEAVERAGNYGVPLALLLAVGLPRDVKGWFRPLAPCLTRTDPAAPLLAWTTALLLFGHGALAALAATPVLASHLALVGLPSGAATIAGWIEMMAALIVAVRPTPSLLFTIMAWKMATEALYPISGTPIWEFVERAGSYAAPLALALILIDTRSTNHILKRSSR